MATIQINGVETEVPAGAIAYKYADPTEDARWIYDESDLAEIRREDPSLIVKVEAMNKYVVTEKQDVNSVRKGLVIEAADLAAAKRRASREQMFQGTVMTIESESGALLAIKQDGKWRDTE